MAGPNERWNLLGVLSAWGIALVVLVGCNTADESEPGLAADTDPAAGPVPEQQFFDYRLIESEMGVTQWILESDQMQKFSGHRDVVLIRVGMDFFRDGEHFSVLTSDSGTTNLQTRRTHVWGNVVVVTDDGRKLETEELYFDNETELITNEVFNRFTREHDVMTGFGLEATPDLEYIEIKDNVQAEVDDSSDEAQPENGPTSGHTNDDPGVVDGD